MSPQPSAPPTADPRTTAGRPYSSPYRIGLGLGLCLLAAFLVQGRGLGASGAFSTVVSVVVDAVAPEHAAGNAMFSSYLANGPRHPLADRLVVMVLGVLAGGLLSARLAGRVRVEVRRGPRIARAPRLALAFTGGILMGFAARLARGCTSGLGLSGGSLLSVGAWIFLLALFAAGFAAARLVRRQWT